MRPLRVLILATSSAIAILLAFLSVRSARPHRIIATKPAEPASALRALFTFQVPFSLFPPNAIITLTYENSTAFLARPAAFGPPLPSEGLIGRVWIGSGFGEESIRRGSLTASAEGELGCSDVPGWDEGDVEARRRELQELHSTRRDAVKRIPTGPIMAHSDDGPLTDTYIASENAARKDEIEPAVDDGTDDYLHHPLPESLVSLSAKPDAGELSSSHADIQSLQEGAEVAGKIVLLSRGGCGFVEKAKWAQRRGAIALIVGDNVKGGSLIQMYARGDTSNVTIPAVFTSRTTAHLLSSLIETENCGTMSVDEEGRRWSKGQRTGQDRNSQPTFTQTTVRPKATSNRSPGRASDRKASTTTADKAITTRKPSWWKSLFTGYGSGNSKVGTSRPPSSGQLDWDLVDNLRSKDGHNSKAPSNLSPVLDPPNTAKGSQKGNAGDEFVIGVQDWRDPDVIDATTAGAANDRKKPVTAKTKSGVAEAKDPQNTSPLRGGSITPGSGEYGSREPIKNEKPASQDKPESQTSSLNSNGFLAKLLAEDIEVIGFEESSKADLDTATSGSKRGGGSPPHEGLWVTLTPTSSAAPFLDTLLVLFVSPLVTLTVVYALLLVRSRIRRRRWRAPKSVVERLPVRTYYTVSTSGCQASPMSDSANASVTTPLLRHTTPDAAARPRPRSRTTMGIPESNNLQPRTVGPLEVPASPPRIPEREKNGTVASEWKTYKGRQVECVVCLEEYVDGVCRVMSLPCGHEFHADCITPWLITRRRTCPICKGDVVRSLARGAPSSLQSGSYHDDSEDDDDMEDAAVDSSAHRSDRSLDENEADLEQGAVPARQRPSRTDNVAGSWRSLLASRFDSIRGTPRPPEDRSR